MRAVGLEPLFFDEAGILGHHADLIRYAQFVGTGSVTGLGTALQPR